MSDMELSLLGNKGANCRMVTKHSLDAHHFTSMVVEQDKCPGDFLGWAHVQKGIEKVTALCTSSSALWLPCPICDGAYLVCLKPQWLLHLLYASTGVQLGWWLSTEHIPKTVFSSVTTSIACSAPEELCQLPVDISSLSSPSGTAGCHVCPLAPCHI